MSEAYDLITAKETFYRECYKAFSAWVKTASDETMPSSKVFFADEKTDPSVVSFKAMCDSFVQSYRNTVIKAKKEKV